MTYILFGAAIFDVGFFVFHAFFWRLFRWGKQLDNLAAVNKAVMQVMNLCLMVVFLMFAYFCAFEATQLVGTDLGRKLLSAMALFWALRAVMQPAFFGLKTVSHGFTVLFLFGAALHGLPLLI